MLSDKWYAIRKPPATGYVGVINEALLPGARLEAGYTFEEVVIMTPYEFNKNMRDAYNVGKYGPIEVTLEDLLEDDPINGPQADNW